jgi:hypothetical protein
MLADIYMPQKDRVPIIALSDSLSDTHLPLDGLKFTELA